MKATHTSKIILFSMIIVLSGSLAIPAAAAEKNAPEKYAIDTAHTYILFRVKHVGIGYSYGRILGPTGTLTFDESSPANSGIEMQVKAKDIFTGIEKRDNHLRSPDFFNVDKYPLISFKSTSAKKIAEDTYEISGDLALLGKSLPITIKVNQTGSGKDPWGKYRRGFETSFTIKRSTFGMDFMLGGVSDEVNLTVSVEGIRQ